MDSTELQQLQQRGGLVVASTPEGPGKSPSGPDPAQVARKDDASAHNGIRQPDPGPRMEASAAMALSAVSPAPLPSLPLSLTWKLYTSHFLSTWNSRLFEFAAVLFLASIYPDTLQPMSIYALVRSAAAILFAQPVGAWIDTGNRLTVVRTSILGGRLAVAASCGVFWVMEVKKDGGLERRAMDGLFALLVVLACVEKLCAVLNLVSVERDWVVVMTEGNEGARRILNARMRRIDLLCKLLGPLAISTITIASTMIAIWVTLAMNILSVAIEYWCIARVFKAVPALQAPSESESRHGEDSSLLGTPDAGAPRKTILQHIKAHLSRVLPIASLPFYLRHPAFLPSFSLALLYLTVLSFSGQMITYLLSVGYTSLHVGIARTVSSIFELSATWIAPRLMNKIGVVRGGFWSLGWQMATLAGAVGIFFADIKVPGGGGPGGIVSATGLVVGVVLSRAGLWGFDLCAQMIVQDEVPPGHRGAFSTVEAAFQNLFELLSFASTIVFSRPDQFQWPVVISVVAVYMAGAQYTYFVRKRRGHLFHAPECICPKVELQA